MISKNNKLVTISSIMSYLNKSPLLAVMGLYTLLLTACDLTLGDQQETPLEEGSIRVTVVGHVVDSSTEERLSNASVLVYAVGGDNELLEEVSERVESLEDGGFTIPYFVIDSIRNRYKIFVSKDGYRTNDDTTLFALLPGEINAGTIRLQSSNIVQKTRVSGTVVNGFEGDERRLEHAEVTLYERSPDGAVGAVVCEVQSDVEGRFMCDRLLFGEYQLKITLDGYSSINEAISVFQQLELGYQRLYNNSNPKDLTIVLNWKSPQGLRVNLDLWLDIANTHPLIGDDIQRYEPVVFGLNESYVHPYPDDFIQRASGFAQGTSYWPLSTNNQRISLKQDQCGYPLISVTGEVPCGTLSAEEKSSQYFIQFRRTSADGSAPEVLSIFGDQLPVPDDYVFPLDEMYAYRAHNDTDLIRYPLAMAALVISAEDFEVLDFDGLDAEQTLPATIPRLRVYQGIELIGDFSMDEISLPLGENINQWLPIMIEYGVTSEAHLYFEVHPVGKTEISRSSKLWAYLYPENKLSEVGGPKVVTPLGMASGLRKAVTIGRDQNGALQFDIHEGSRSTNRFASSPLNLPIDIPQSYDPKLISLTANTVNVVAVSEDNEIKLFLGTDPPVSCGFGNPNVIISFGSYDYLVGTDQGLSPCVIHGRESTLAGTIEGWPQMKITSTGVIPNSPWFLIGGDSGLFANFQYGREFDVPIQISDESVVAIHEDIVAFESGDIVIVTNNRRIFKITDVRFNGVYAIHKFNNYVLVSDVNGLNSIEILDLRSDIDLLGLSFQNSVVNQIAVPDSTPIRHLSSLNTVGFFYSQGQLREIH